MSFTKQLRIENEDVFQRIFTHPFVEGIGKGEVPKEALAHYIKADYEYLNAFMHVYGLAISKSPDRQSIRLFHDQIGFVLNSEVHPHHNFCEQIGMSYEDLQGYPLPPTADHYVKHMLYHAHHGGIGEILAALLPCPWTYYEIGVELMKTYQPEDSHPFLTWIQFYADVRTKTLTNLLCEHLDAYAEQASESEKIKMREAFRKSCQLEYSFWEMAYTQEEWPAEEEVVR
ncbi:thiaminase (transcriptional activator TenA) [Halobacillus karajensis]|uniref:Aminopyrimidine aminohydrolase n=1 Tax=Halobacillus karajensis TaxID=195088 RepID=A0A059NZ59_9BACI|nr:thiaminase II [Halobacillus karajensis]CDQ18616.1 Putative thiaminase-2 [Halobacillus karajensis]CDQ23312.1 Putative thiaminase-2 [Halobacillus karajensis]CDQ26794.1 Putative thiaminase-2 [Halobacillus karajensis]SEH49110.1 thiaminase (transcriptional activator TenA) [Halobacillus karajensis]